MQMAPLKHMLGTQTAPKRGIFWPFWTDFETKVHYLPLPPPLGFLLKTFCDCTTHL